MTRAETVRPEERHGGTPLDVFRRYVTGFVNRHDFGVLPDIMQPDYTLETASVTVTGRDTDYRQAVARQMRQFPGLVFTLHELFVCEDAIAVRFTEHGASNRHDGALAAWPSIAIYDTHDGLLAKCTIEQDYVARNRQLASGTPDAIDPPAIAPWDATRCTPCASDEVVVRDWLTQGLWLRPGPVQIDDSRATGSFEPIIAGSEIVIDRMVSSNGKVAFHAIHRGPLDGGFASSHQTTAGQPAHIPLSGLVTVRDGAIVAGNIIRDRLGLARRVTDTGGN